MNESRLLRYKIVLLVLTGSGLAGCHMPVTQWQCHAVGGVKIELPKIMENESGHWRNESQTPLLLRPKGRQTVLVADRLSHIPNTLDSGSASTFVIVLNEPIRESPVEITAENGRVMHQSAWGATAPPYIELRGEIRIQSFENDAIIVDCDLREFLPPSNQDHNWPPEVLRGRRRFRWQRPGSYDGVQWAALDNSPKTGEQK